MHQSAVGASTPPPKNIAPLARKVNSRVIMFTPR